MFYRVKKLRKLCNCNPNEMLRQPFQTAGPIAAETFYAVYAHGLWCKVSQKDGLLDYWVIC